MGCVESVPVAQIDLDRVHAVDPSIATLGGLPPSNEKVEVLMKERVFSWVNRGPNVYTIKRPDGSPFWGMDIKGKAEAARDQMNLFGPDGVPVAVCLRDYDGNRDGHERFTIYSLEPLYPGQKPSFQQVNNRKLYDYAVVNNNPMSRNYHVRYHNETSSSIDVFLTNEAPKRRVVKRRFIVAATIDGGRWGETCNTYKITTCPGIDMCLMICVTAVCDEMDEVGAFR